MGVIDVIRRRDDRGRTSQAFVPEADGSKETNASNPTETEVPPDASSLEWQDEKEVQNRPDQINDRAQLGVQKAEAAALVYTKKVVIGIYAWCVFNYSVLSRERR